MFDMETDDDSVFKRRLKWSGKRMLLNYLLL